MRIRYLHIFFKLLLLLLCTTITMSCADMMRLMLNTVIEDDEILIIETPFLTKTNDGVLIQIPNVTNYDSINFYKTYNNIKFNCGSYSPISKDNYASTIEYTDYFVTPDKEYFYSYTCVKNGISGSNIELGSIIPNNGHGDLKLSTDPIGTYDNIEGIITLDMPNNANNTGIPSDLTLSRKMKLSGGNSFTLTNGTNLINLYNIELLKGTTQSVNTLLLEYSTTKQGITYTWNSINYSLPSLQRLTVPQDQAGIILTNTQKGVEITFRTIGQISTASIYRKKNNTSDYVEYMVLSGSITSVNNKVTVTDYFVTPESSYSYYCAILYTSSATRAITDTVSIQPTNGVGELIMTGNPVATYSDISGLLEFSTLPEIPTITTDNAELTYSLSYFWFDINSSNGGNVNCSFSPEAETINLRQIATTSFPDSIGKELYLDSMTLTASKKINQMNLVWYGTELLAEKCTHLPTLFTISAE